MNILEEIPNSKTPSKSPLLSKSISNTPSTKKSIFESSDNETTSFIKNNTSSNNKDSNSSNLALSDSFVLFDFRTLIIIILLILVAMTYFGINVMSIFGNAIQKGVDVASPAFSNFLSLVGYSTGTAINKTAEIASNAATGGVEIAEGATQSIGNIIIGDKAVGHKKYGAPNDPLPDSPEDSIQKSLSSAKTKWCLVGEYQNKRGCIDLSESDKCLSGQVFPSEEMCLNPALSKNQ